TPTFVETLDGRVTVSESPDLLAFGGRSGLSPKDVRPTPGKRPLTFRGRTTVASPRTCVMLQMPRAKPLCFAVTPRGLENVSCGNVVASRGSGVGGGALPSHRLLLKNGLVSGRPVKWNAITRPICGTTTASTVPLDSRYAPAQPRYASRVTRTEGDLATAPEA